MWCTALESRIVADGRLGYNWDDLWGKWQELGLEVIVQRSQGLNRKEMHTSNVPPKGHLIKGLFTRSEAASKGSSKAQNCMPETVMGEHSQSQAGRRIRGRTGSRELPAWAGALKEPAASARGTRQEGRWRTDSSPPFSPTLWLPWCPQAKRSRRPEGQEPMDAGPVASFPGTERVHGSRGARGRQPVWGARGRHSLSVPGGYCTERRHSSEEGVGERWGRKEKRREKGKRQQQVKTDKSTGS